MRELTVKTNKRISKQTEQICITCQNKLTRTRKKNEIDVKLKLFISSNSKNTFILYQSFKFNFRLTKNFNSAQSTFTLSNLV